MGSSGGGGGGGGGNTTNTIRYAPYIESHHSNFLNNTQAQVNNIIGNSPYASFYEVPVEAGFFGTGYVLASFPALFDLYGKFIAGLDIDSLWAEIMDSTTESPQANNLVSAESALLNDELESSILPKFYTGMRDLNAVMSSSFVMGKALLYDTKQKLVEKFSAELKWKLVAVAQDRWKAHLAWNTEAVTTYAKLFDLYFSAKTNITKLNFEMFAKNRLWPMEVLDYQRANLGALQGAIKQTQDKGGGSSSSSILGGALGGAAAGGMATGGNPMGMLVGGVLGGVAGLF